MVRSTFDRETLLDLTVNVIPLVIILFFVVLFAVVRPFGFSAVPVAIQYALLIAPFVGLAILTYYAGKAISNDEKEMEAAEAAAAGLEDAGELDVTEATDADDAADDVDDATAADGSEAEAAAADDDP